MGRRSSVIACRGRTYCHIKEAFGNAIVLPHKIPILRICGIPDVFGFIFLFVLIPLFIEFQHIVSHIAFCSFLRAHVIPEDIINVEFHVSPVI